MMRFLTRQFFWGVPVLSVLLSAAVFLFYLTTMNHGLYWFDSAELALAGHTLGVSHPPGQPLYILLLHLLSAVVPTQALLLMNAFSSLCAALLPLVCSKIVFQLLPGLKLQRLTLATMYILLAIVALHPLVWDQATKIELYPFATLLSLIHFSMLLDLRTSFSPKLKHWLGLGLLLGLLFCVHPILAVTNGLTVIALMGLRGVFPQTIGFLFGLSPYIYILSASVDANRLVWGRFDSLSGLLFYLRGSDYKTNPRCFASTAV